jgi:hypothetical protein
LNAILHAMCSWGCASDSSTADRSQAALKFRLENCCSCLAKLVSQVL